MKYRLLAYSILNLLLSRISWQINRTLRKQIIFSKFVLNKKLVNTPTFDLSKQSPRKALTDTTQMVASKLPKFDLDMDINKVTVKDKTEKESAVVGHASTKQTMEFNPDLEPLLRENPRRFVIFPIQYEDIWQMYKKVICISIHRISYLIGSTNKKKQIYFSCSEMQENIFDSKLCMFTGRSFDMERCRSRSVPWPGPLARLKRWRTKIHQSRSGLFRSFWRHCQWEFGWTFQPRGSGDRSTLLLRFPGCHREYSFGNVQFAYPNLHFRSRRTVTE